MKKLPPLTFKAGKVMKIHANGFIDISFLVNSEYKEPIDYHSTTVPAELQVEGLKFWWIRDFDHNEIAIVERIEGEPPRGYEKEYQRSLNPDFIYIIWPILRFLSKFKEVFLLLVLIFGIGGLLLFLKLKDLID